MSGTENIGTLLPMSLEEELKKSFMSYAMAVIVTRALPDVRDGLKPVQRRILYAMTELGLTPDKPYRKSATVVGEVLGKYHPHGDTAVYDAMVRMAQDFSMRGMLVDGQGNYGSVDGDDPAAMRYTEARLSKLALELTRDIDKETVDFYPNYDERLLQPDSLPSRYPNLLVNGATGIAVGMATNIPPHNLGEVIDGVVHMIDYADCTTEDLMKHIKGPDFPTGGIIQGTAGIHEAYATGRGRVITRARTEIEPMNNGRDRIVVTEIPYMVNKARLVEKMAELVHEKRLEGISDIRDESDRVGMRIVVELKRDVSANVVLNYLYKHTQMQETFGVNMLALVDGAPKVLSLRSIIYHYLEHQKSVVRRRTQYDLDKANARAHILDGLIRALDIIDEIIACIRASGTTQIAREELMSRFDFSDRQAQAILDMRLQRLTGLERDRLIDEYDELMRAVTYLMGLLADEALLMGVIREEILEIKARFVDSRRTEISVIDGEIDMLDLIQEEDMVVTLTHLGYVKRLPQGTYRAQKRGGRGIIGASKRAEDFIESIIVCSTHDPLLFFTSRGRVYKLMCYEIPEAGRTARGTAIVNLLPLEGGEKVNALIPLPKEVNADKHYLTMATRDGLIKKTPLDELNSPRKSGLIAITLRDEDEMIGVALTNGDMHIIMGTKNGRAGRFEEADIRPSGRGAMGVKSFNLDEGDIVVSMSVTGDDDAAVLCVSENGYGKRTELSEYPVHRRGGKGVLAMKLTEKSGDMVSQMIVDADEDILLITDDGTVIRMNAGTISLLSRNTQGVRLMRVGGNASVVCVARSSAEDDDEDEIIEVEGEDERD